MLTTEDVTKRLEEIERKAKPNAKKQKAKIMSSKQKSRNANY